MSIRSMFLSDCACAILLSAALGLASRGAHAADEYAENPGKEGNGNHVIGPDYAIDPDLTDRGNPKGKQFEFSMRLADSKIFPGDDATLDPKKPVRKERKVFVYVPAAYQDGTKAPLLVTLALDSAGAEAPLILPSHDGSGPDAAPSPTL